MRNCCKSEEKCFKYNNWNSNCNCNKNEWKKDKEETKDNCCEFKCYCCPIEKKEPENSCNCCCEFEKKEGQNSWGMNNCGGYYGYNNYNYNQCGNNQF